MHKTPKSDPEPKTEEIDQEKDKTWEEDQKKREYYYDDAHGYQTYNPVDDNDPIDENKKAPGHVE
jgi:hypothetical protein